MAYSSPLFSPASDKRVWSTLRSPVDELIDDRNAMISLVQNVDPDPPLPTQINSGLKGDSLLLFRGFDTVSQTLSQLSNNLDSALLGARELAKPPTLTDIFHSNLKNSEATEEVEEDSKIGLKRKFDSTECSDENRGDDSQKENDQSPKKQEDDEESQNCYFFSFAFTWSATIEQKASRWINEGDPTEEDDLVRLQLETLLAEKSRLANENANLVRENQCLHQLVEYHQMTSHDLCII
ncbi:hypothetical protein REPUB_Repub12eG0119400 [Reevesia pubescens]